MSITRIGESLAKPETTEALRDFLLSIIPLIKSSQGCESVTLYQSHDDPTRFTMIEVWDSIESHQASVKNIPPEMLTEIRPLLASSLIYQFTGFGFVDSIGALGLIYFSYSEGKEAFEKAAGMEDCCEDENCKD